jgi:hypothetical protein
MSTQELARERAGARHARSLNRPRFARQNCESPIFWRISPWGQDLAIFEFELTDREREALDALF